MGVSASRPRVLEGIPPAALEAFCFAEQNHLSPMRFRHFFIVGISELEHTLVAPLWLLRTEPEEPRVQLRLLAFLRVYARLIDLGLDPIRAGFHMRNTPIGTFGHRTLFEVVRDRQFDEALGYLDSISSGFVG